MGTPILPDRYDEPRLVGRGGMGEIYIARDRLLARTVAVKVLAERFAQEPELRERFRREALTAARLSGEAHVVTIFDVGEHGGRPYTVMEYLPGGTLAEHARRAPVRPEQALAWLTEVAAALDAAHAKGVVHRDVKPANLLFDGSGHLQVVDFGIARVMDETLGLTAPGTILGTAGYLAPEQALGQETTAASDRYALAVVAYELSRAGGPSSAGPRPPRLQHISTIRCRRLPSAASGCRSRSTRSSPAASPRGQSTGSRPRPPSSRLCERRSPKRLHPHSHQPGGAPGDSGAHGRGALGRRGRDGRSRGLPGARRPPQPRRAERPSTEPTTVEERAPARGPRREPPGARGRRRRARGGAERRGVRPHAGGPVGGRSPASRACGPRPWRERIPTTSGTRPTPSTTSDARLPSSTVATRPVSTSSARSGSRGTGRRSRPRSTSARRGRELGRESRQVVPRTGGDSSRRTRPT